MDRKENFFVYSKKERRGIAVLIVILIAAIILPLLLTDKQTSNSSAVYDEFQQEVYEFEKHIAAINDSVASSKQKRFDFNYPDYSISEAMLKPFPFNPNGLPAEKWKEIGLKDWQIKVIKNYESKGGKFYKKEDLGKMYCLKETEYKVLEPYIVIPKPEYSKEVKTSPKTNKFQKQIVEINSADSATLTNLSGIGPVFASRIIKYRNLLGGYARAEQLLEVYGMKTETYEKILPYVTINTELVSKINVNTISTDELKKHPYLNYYTAKAIVDYRIINGEIKNVEELKNIKLIHEDLYNKIKNYITL